MSNPEDGQSSRPRLEPSGVRKSLLLQKPLRNRQGRLGKEPPGLDAQWEEEVPKRREGAWIWMVSVVMAVIGVSVTAYVLRQDLFPSAATRVTPVIPQVSVVVDDQIPLEMEAAQSVVLQFLNESDPVERLKWVRNEEQVRLRLDEYSEEARSMAGVIDKMIGHGKVGDHLCTAFAVLLDNGSVRLIELVDTEDGPKIDWDAYARYCTATWEDLWSGKAERAIVRVFCSPGLEYPEPFSDQSKWTCFQLTGPDLPHPALAYAKVGSVREQKMKEIILAAQKFRQRFALEVVRHEGGGEPLFEITRCLEVGWVGIDRLLEDEWQEAP